jgi:hypothetical protein
MVKARFAKEVDGEQVSVVFLGLEEGNIAHLKTGKPILVDLREMGLTGQILISYGVTQTDILNDLKIAGLMPVPGIEGNSATC